MTKKIRCPFCSSLVRPERKKSGSGFVTFILVMFVFIIGGIIYEVVFRHWHNYCPECGMRLD
jgi:uncharacterized protein (DUF2225 family)